MIRRRGLQVICLLIACVGGPLVFGRTYIYPSHETTFTPSEYQPVGYFSRDPMGQFAELSFAAFSTEAIRSGEIPYWNPYTALGFPFLADPSMAALFAPQNWLRVVLPWTLWDVIFVLNILIGGYCLFRWLALSGLDAEAAAVGALSWWALGTTQIYFNVPSIFNVVTALPVALFGIEAQARNHASRQGRVLTAVGAFGVVVGGHPTVTFVCGIFLITYLALRTLFGGGVTAAGRAVFWLAIGVLVAACQWLPFVDYLRFRGNTLADYTNVRFQLAHLPALVVPTVYGFLNSFEPPVPGAAGLGGYWSLGWISPAIGILLIAGFVAGFRRSPVGSACLGASLMCYAWSFGVPGLQQASTLPFLNRIQGNYFPLVANVALPFFVAQGFRWIRDGGRRRAPVAMLAWLILMVAASIWAAVLVRPASGSVIDTLDVFVRRSWPSWAWMAVTATAWMAFAPRANEVDRFAFWTGVVVFGAVAFYPWAGASLRKEAFCASVAALFLVLAIPRLGRPFDVKALHIPLATVLLFVVHGALTFSGTGLPRRHDLLASGTYPGFLRSELDGTAQRAYGILGYLFPNAGPAERIATLNTLVAMLPLQVETFLQVLDQKQFAVQLLGLVSRPAVGHDSATAAVLQNRSLWNYIGSRFIVAPLDGFVDRILPGSVFEVRGGWPGDESVPMPLPARGAKTAGNTWSIACGGDDWEAVVVKLSTYSGAAAQGEVDLELRGNNEQVLARTRLDGGRVQDNGFAMLFVGRPFCRANDTLQLRIEQRGYGPGGTDAVWVDRASTKILHYGLIPAPPNTSRTGTLVQFPLSKGATGWLRCPVGTADEIRLPFTTSPRPAGTITAALRTMDGSVRESEQFRAQEGMTGIHIRLPAGLCEAETRLVRVEVEYRPAAAGDEIYYFARPEEPLVLDLIDRPDDFVLRFVDQALKGAVLENMEAEKGVFVASAIKTVASWQEGLAAFQSSTRKGDVAFVEGPSVCAERTQDPAAAGAGQVTVQGRTLNTLDLTVETTRPAMLVWASSYAPGWSADLDGEHVPVHRVNGVFTGACIPAAGSHKVTFRYFPPGLLPGFMISLVTACGAALLVVRKTAHEDLV